MKKIGSWYVQLIVYGEDNADMLETIEYVADADTLVCEITPMEKTTVFYNNRTHEYERSYLVLRGDKFALGAAASRYVEVMKTWQIGMLDSTHKIRQRLSRELISYAEWI